MEPKPNPDNRKSTSNSTQIGELFDRVVEFLAEAPSILAYGWNSYRRPIVNLAIVLASLSAILVVFDFIGSVNHLILIPTLFTVLGIIQAARFGYRNVLFAKDRQRLLQQVRSVKQELIGSSSVAGLLESDRAIEVQAIEVEDPLTLNPTFPQEEVNLPLEAIVPSVIAPPLQNISTVSEEPVIETAIPEASEPLDIVTEEPINSEIPEIAGVTSEEEITEDLDTVAETTILEEDTSEDSATIAETVILAEETVEETLESTEEITEDLDTVAETTILEEDTSEDLATIEETVTLVEETVEATLEIEEEQSSEDTVLEAEPEIITEVTNSEPQEVPLVEEETNLPKTIAVEPETVDLVSESTPAQPEDLEQKDAKRAEETAADHSEATVKAQTPAKFLGFEKKTPKKSPKKSSAKTEALATDKTHQLEQNLTVEETETDRSRQENLNPIAPQSLSLDDLLFSTNGVDELRYLLISSQVELIDSPEQLQGITYSQQSETLGIGVVNAEGEKCERCWNYSKSVGRSIEHPTVCDRCIAALSNKF